MFKCKPAPEMLQPRPPTARPGSAGVPSAATAAPPPPENWLERLAVRSGHSVTAAGAQVLTCIYYTVGLLAARRTWGSHWQYPPILPGPEHTWVAAQVLLFGGRLSTEDCLTSQLLRLDKGRMNWHAQVSPALAMWWLTRFLSSISTMLWWDACTCMAVLCNRGAPLWRKADMVLSWSFGT